MQLFMYSFYVSMQVENHPEITRLTKAIQAENGYITRKSPENQSKIIKKSKSL